MQLRSYDRRSVVFLVLGTLLFGWVLFGWWQKDYMNPDKVFKDMLSYSMNTYGYTKIIEQKNEGQDTLEKTQAFYGPFNGVYSITSITQKKNNAVTGRVVTETIGNASQESVRYVEISSDLKKPDGSPVDFNGLVGVWARNDIAAGPNAFLATKYGLVPFGMLTPSQRQEMLNFISKKDVYSYKVLEDAPDTDKNTLVYKVKINQKAQVEMIKKYAELTGDKSLDSINPDDYANGKDIEAQFYIKKNSRQLTKIRFVSFGVAEEYAGYGIQKNLPVPEAKLSTQELQKQLSDKAATAKRE